MSSGYIDPATGMMIDSSGTPSATVSATIAPVNDAPNGMTPEQYAAYQQQMIAAIPPAITTDATYVYPQTNIVPAIVISADAVVPGAGEIPNVNTIPAPPNTEDSLKAQIYCFDAAYKAAQAMADDFRSRRNAAQANLIVLQGGRPV